MRPGLIAALLLFCAGAPGVAQTAGVFDTPTTTAMAEVQRKNLEDLANDLPQLAHYREANAKLPAPDPRRPRVVFLGDSLTEAWGLASNGSSFFPGAGYLNRGISGQTATQMLLRFRQDVIDLHPAVVVLLAGTNDFAGNMGPASPAMVAESIQSMVELARSNGIRVVMCSVMPTAGYRWRPDAHPVEAIRSLNAWLKEFAGAHGLVYVDYYTTLTTPAGAMRSELSHDGVHLNAKGYDLIAPLASAGIRAALDRVP